MRTEFACIPAHVKAALCNGLTSSPNAAPLDLSEDLLVPAEIRTLMRVLKNAGYTPPEIALLKSIANVEKELAALPSRERTEKAEALITKIAMLREAQNAARLD